MQGTGVELAQQRAEDEVGHLAGIGFGRRSFKEVGHGAALHQHFRFRFRQARHGDEALHAGGGQFGQFLLPAAEFLISDGHGQQVGIREVAVVVRLFLAAHGGRDVFRGIVQAGLLHDLFPVCQGILLTGDLIIDGPLHVAERVQVLELGTGTESGAAHETDGNVGITAEAALLHVAVAHAQIGHDAVQGLEVGHGFGGRTHVRFGNDLHQRRPGTVEVHIADVLALGMDVLARVILHVDARDADALFGAVHRDRQMAMLTDGQVELRDLVAGRQVGVKIVFTGKDGIAVDAAIGGKAHQAGVVHGLPVEHGQGAGHAAADFADIAVGSLPETGGAGAEKFGGRSQLYMDFQADDGFICRHEKLREPDVRNG